MADQHACIRKICHDRCPCFRRDKGFLTDPSLEPSLALPFVKAIFSCQMYEKPSIQNCVTVIAENCLAHFAEPSFIVYSIDSPSLQQAASKLESILPFDFRDDALVKRGTENTKSRVRLQTSCIQELVKLHKILGLR